MGSFRLNIAKRFRRFISRRASSARNALRPRAPTILSISLIKSSGSTTCALLVGIDVPLHCAIILGKHRSLVLRELRFLRYAFARECAFGPYALLTPGFIPRCGQSVAAAVGESHTKTHFIHSLPS